MRPLRTLCLLFALATLGTAGCSHLPWSKAKHASASAQGEPEPEFIEVAVQNHNWSDVVVELAHSGQRTRLGTVTASSDATLRFPSRFVAGALPVQLIAKPIGAPQAFASERFVVHPGQTVEWTLESSLQRSSLAIY